MCQKIVVTLPNNLRIRVALYIRVSTEEQAKHGLSLADQREALTDYAAAHNMEVEGLVIVLCDNRWLLFDSRSCRV